MSLWKKVERLPLNLKHGVCKKYAESGISIQIRNQAAKWLEKNLRPSIQNPDEKETGEIVLKLTEELRMRGRELGRNWESFAGCQLQKIAADLEKQNPMEVHRKIEACLLEEMRILRENPSQICEEKLSNLIDVKRKSESKSRVEKSPRETLMSELRQKMCENRWSWIYIIEILLPGKNEREVSTVAMETLENLNKLVSTFSSEILTVLKLGGASEFLWEKVEKLYSDIFKMIGELVDFWQKQNDSGILRSILKKLDHLKFLLLQNSLFCHQAPPQIISHGAKISTGVKFLRGNSNFNKFSSPTEKVDVHVKMVNEKQAADLLKAGGSYTFFEPSSQNHGNTGKNSANENTNFEFFFRNFSVDISEVPKNSSEITDKKYRLIFYTSSSLNDEKKSKIWCLSSPFFIISSEAEERAALSAIFWENCLSSKWNENSFKSSQTPNEIPWSIVRQNLSKFFSDRTETKKPLTMENLNYLGQRLVKIRDFHPNSDFLITREMIFAPENLNVWDWFYAALELTRKHLREFWDNGEILGFAEVEKARKRFLYEENPGEFLMCFPETESGVISVSVIHPQGRSKKFLRTFHPFGESQLMRRSLSERIEIISRGMSRCFSDSDSDSNSDSNLDSETEDLPKPRSRKSSNDFDFTSGSDCSSQPKMSRAFPEVKFQVSVHSEFSV